MYCVYRARVCNIHMAATVPRLRTALSRSRRPPGVARIPAAGTGSQYRAVCLRGFIMQIIQYYILLISLYLSLSLFLSLFLSLSLSLHSSNEMGLDVLLFNNFRGLVTGEQCCVGAEMFSKHEKREPI